MLAERPGGRVTLAGALLGVACWAIAYSQVPGHGGWPPWDLPVYDPTIWQTFLHHMTWISVAWTILNLLPIPILDGGQALMFTVEGVKRSPLSLRTRELVQQLGLVVLVALMGFAFWNDISRHWSSFLEWVKGL